MLRVISGKYRGRLLIQPNLSITRPTTDKAKEAIFSMIQFSIPKSVVLDLFSGSGSLAIEAASRGAMKCFAVDKNPQCVQVIADNIKNLNINNVVVIKADVLQYLQQIKGTKYDFIFMDPPFLDIRLCNQTLSLINQYDLLKFNKGLIILETDKPNEIVIPKGLTIQKTKKYGISTIVFLAMNV